MDKILQKKLALSKYLKKHLFEYNGIYYIDVDMIEFNYAEDKDDYLSERGVELNSAIRRNWDDNHFNYKRCTYLIVDEMEITKELDDRLEIYIDNIILSNLNIEHRRYFDSNAWKKDNKNNRGRWLNFVDDKEYSELIDGITYYIYRQ